MANYTLWTEEGRTRLRNFQKRVNSYFVLWLVVGMMATVGSIYLRTRYGYEPLQRLYLQQYILSLFKSFLPKTKPSKYTFLVRVVEDKASGNDFILGVNDREVKLVADDKGKVKYDQGLPVFRLKDGIPYKDLRWMMVEQQD